MHEHYPSVYRRHTSCELARSDHSLSCIEQEAGQLYKIVIMGDQAVGKTCLLKQFTESSFTDTYCMTMGVESRATTIDISGRVVKLQCWDAGGRESFRSIVRSYYRRAAGALIVYDVTQRDSFNNTLQWLEDVRSHSGSSLPVLLVGNKRDLQHERQVSFEEAQRLAEQNAMGFKETSALTAANVLEAFTALCGSICQRHQELQKR